jgi:large subunit ribosomal protein L24
MYLCPVTQKPTRLGVRMLDGGRRVRFSKKSNDSVE